MDEIIESNVQLGKLHIVTEDIVRNVKDTVFELINKNTPFHDGVVASDFDFNEDKKYEIGSENRAAKAVYTHDMYLMNGSMHINGTQILNNNEDEDVILTNKADKNVVITSTGAGKVNIISEQNINMNSVNNINMNTNNVVVNSDTISLNGIVTVKELNVIGNKTQVNSNDLTVKDNIIELNSGEINEGVSAGTAGIKIDRGTADPYIIQFNEANDKLEIGIQNDLHIVATENFVKENIDSAVENAIPNTGIIIVGEGNAVTSITEENGIFTINQDKSFSEENHNHNELYYTKDDVNNKLTDKSDITHTHLYAGAATEAGSALSAEKLTVNAGLNNKPVYFENGIPVEINYTVDTNVPANAKFTDTITDVTIQGEGNAITSITAENGQLTINKDKIFSEDNHNHDELYYSKDEIDTKLANKSDTTHTHLYAGAATEAGSALSAEKLTVNAGTNNKPVYFENGVPVEINYTVDTNVPANAKFTDTITDVTIQGEGNAITSITAENGQLTINKDKSFSEDNHNHDELYYGKDEIDTKLSEKATKTDLITKANADDVYRQDELYTKADIDAKLAQKADTSALALKADLTSRYDSKEVDDKLSVKANTADVYNKSLLYTKTEIDNLLLTKAPSSLEDSKANKSDVYTKTEVDNFVNAKANSTDMLTALETKELLDKKANREDVYVISQVYTKDEIDTALNNKASNSELDVKANKSDVFTQEEINTKLAEKSDKIDVYTKTEIDALLNDKTNNDVTDLKANKSDVYTQTTIDNLLKAKLEKTDVYAKDELYTQSQIDNKIQNITDTLDLKANLADLISKVDNSVVYTKSEINDKFDAVYTKEEVSEMINTAVNLAVAPLQNQINQLQEKINLLENPTE